MNNYIEQKQQEYWETMIKAANEQLEAAKAENRYWSMKYQQENRMHDIKP